MTSKEEAGSFDTMMTAAPEENPDDDTRSRQEKEEKLILTAWQSMSSALQQHSLCKDVRAPGPAQSFLAKQRQSTQTRRTLSPRLQPPSTGRMEEVSPLTGMLGCKVVEEGITTDDV